MISQVDGCDLSKQHQKVHRLTQGGWKPQQVPFIHGIPGIIGTASAVAAVAAAF
jgi:hypothetical protein